MAIRAMIVYARYQIYANDDHSWQIRGSKLLEMPLYLIIPRMDIGSSTSLQEYKRVSLGRSCDPICLPEICLFSRVRRRTLLITELIKFL